MKKYLIHVTYLLVIAFLVLYGTIKAEEAELNMKQAARLAQKASESAAEARREAVKVSKVKEALEICQTTGEEKMWKKAQQERVKAKTRQPESTTNGPTG